MSKKPDGRKSKGNSKPKDVKPRRPKGEPVYFPPLPKPQKAIDWSIAPVLTPGIVAYGPATAQVWTKGSFNPKARFGNVSALLRSKEMAKKICEFIEVTSMTKAAIEDFQEFAQRMATLQNGEGVRIELNEFEQSRFGSRVTEGSTMVRKTFWKNIAEYCNVLLQQSYLDSTYWSDQLGDKMSAKALSALMFEIKREVNVRAASLQPGIKYLCAVVIDDPAELDWPVGIKVISKPGARREVSTKVVEIPSDYGVAIDFIELGQTGPDGRELFMNLPEWAFREKDFWVRSF